jgi:hypothetical protein
MLNFCLFGCVDFLFILVIFISGLFGYVSIWFISVVDVLFILVTLISGLFCYVSFGLFRLLIFCLF